MGVARFKVFGRNFDGTKEATVEIDRGPGIFRVRPLRRRKVYELPLAYVAEMVLWSCIKAEVREKKRLKSVRRKAS